MTDAWAGGDFPPRAQCLLAPNPGLMTLDGTNTWVLREPGSSQCVVVDPGPVEEGHLDRLDEELGDVGLVLVTHHHFDHSETAEELGRRKGCPVRAWGPTFTFDADPLADGEVLDDALGVLEYYLVHRRQRLAQVEGALVQLNIETPDLEDEELPRQVVEIVYQDVDESLWGAAEWSVRAQLSYLATR